MPAMSQIELLKARLQTLKTKGSIPNANVNGPSKPSLPKPSPTIQIQSDLDRLSKLVDPEIQIKPQTLPPGMGTLDQSEQVIERINRLRESLEKSIPGYESQLHSIHRQLSKDAEISHLLNDEQIGVIVAAMCKRKNVIISEEKSKASRKKSLKDTTIEDL